MTDVPGCRPAAGEGLPGTVQPLHGEVSEVSLQQLTLVVAKLHVKVSLEDRV